jgi:hypothetical protein
MLGVHYFRYEAPDGATSFQGTFLDSKKVAELVRQAIEAVKTKPTCLHRVVDTTQSIFSDSFNRTILHYDFMKKLGY